MPDNVRPVIIEATMDGDGQLTELVLQQLSGSGAVDQFMIQACKKGLWMRNPPPEARAGDGNYRMRIEAQHSKLYAADTEVYRLDVQDPSWPGASNDCGDSPPPKRRPATPLTATAAFARRIAHCAIAAHATCRPRGLSVPVVTMLDRRGEVLEDEQREVVRFAMQDGRGADIIFAAGTTGEWDRIDNPRASNWSRGSRSRNAAARDAGAKPVEAWVGITAHTRAETLENLEPRDRNRRRCGGRRAAFDYRRRRRRSSFVTREISASVRAPRPRHATVSLR